MHIQEIQVVLGYYGYFRKLAWFQEIEVVSGDSDGFQGVQMVSGDSVSFRGFRWIQEIPGD